MAVLEEKCLVGEGEATADRNDLLSQALLLRGRSLCNFALDGDSPEMQAKEVGEATD